MNQGGETAVHMALIHEVRGEPEKAINSMGTATWNSRKIARHLSKWRATSPWETLLRRRNLWKRIFHFYSIKKLAVY